MQKPFMTAAEILVACEKVSTQAEVTSVKRFYNSLEYGPKSSLPGSGEQIGWGLRMVRNGKLGVAGEWGILNPFRLVDKVIGSCRYGPKAQFNFPADSPESDTSIGDDLKSMTHDDVHIYLNDLKDRIKGIHPFAALSARVQWNKNNFIIMNSNGLQGSYSKTSVHSSFSVTLPRETGLLQSGYTANSTNSLPVLDDVLSMINLPIQRSGQKQRKITGKNSIVFSPVALSVLLQAVQAGVSGKLLTEGASPLASLEGKQVLSDRITIRDMPRLTDGAASAPFDSEGIPTCNKTLFQNGVFTGFIHDLGSAVECGAISTGSSGRNLGNHSKPVCTNLSVDPAASGSVDTLRETGSGILVTNILSAGGGGAASGNFTIDCGRVYLFRQGSIHGYSDGCILQGNVYDALSNVTALGSKQYRCGTDMLPFVSLNGIAIK